MIIIIIKHTHTHKEKDKIGKSFIWILFEQLDFKLDFYPMLSYMCSLHVSILMLSIQYNEYINSNIIYYNNCKCIETVVVDVGCFTFCCRYTNMKLRRRKINSTLKYIYIYIYLYVNSKINLTYI